MKIQILGTGCPKCKKMLEAAETAVKELGIDAEIVKVTNLNEIMKFGVMMTPALVINDEVKLVGKVPTVEQIKKLIEEI